MLTMRWQPFLANEWDQLQKNVNRLYDRAAPWLALAAAYPPVNVWEDDNHVYAEAELPGVPHDKLEVYVTEGDQLTLQGERQPNAPANGAWHRQERGFGKFDRTLTLPAPVDADKVEARFEQGVLFLTLPKSEQARPRKITVKAE
jgi:HSP20 family protein